VLRLFRVRDELVHAAGIVSEGATSFDLTCNEEWLVFALAALQDLAEWLPGAVEKLREEVGEDVAKRAQEMVSRFREYRRRLGCGA
jgi:hypothetical protein